MGARRVFIRLIVPQLRCSGPGTKLKINSSARNRRRNRSASRKSCFRPLGARLEKAGARYKRRYGSNSLHTGFQYCAVDSMTTSVTPSSRSQPDKRRSSLVVVPKRRRCSSPGEAIASPSRDGAMTISTFLCNVNGCYVILIRHGFLLAWKR